MNTYRTMLLPVATAAFLPLVVLLACVSCTPVAPDEVFVVGPTAPPAPLVLQASAIALDVVQQVHGARPDVSGWVLDFKPAADVHRECGRDDAYACTLFLEHRVASIGLDALAHEYLHIAQGTLHIDYAHVGPEWLALGEALNHLASKSPKGVWYEL